MPTISSSRVQPLVTPSTALLTSARASPCSAAWSSDSRTACRCPSFCSSLMPSGSGCSSFPFGPWMRTTLPMTSIFTPCGTGIGFFPIRDIVLSFLSSLHSPESGGFLGYSSDSLVDLAEDFAAHAFAASLAAGHDALRGGEDVDPQSAEDARDLVAANVHAAARARDARQLRHGRFVVRAVLQIHADDLAAFLFRGLEVRDVALLFEDAGDLDLQLRGGYVYLLLLCLDRVSNARQEICDRIGQTHVLLS